MLQTLDIIPNGSIVRVYGVDNSYHGRAKVNGPDRLGCYGNAHYFVSSYLIEFIEPVTDNAKSWNNGLMRGSWIGRLEVEFVGIISRQTFNSAAAFAINKYEKENAYMEMFL